MGSLGARALNAASDLDLIVIYDADGAERSDGRRPLAVQPYYARLTQAMISGLTAQMMGGRLYEVDMRLRPSGNQGPVAVSLAAFRSYQQNEAWGWEHLALTRARALAGPGPLADEIEALRTKIEEKKLPEGAGNPRVARGKNFFPGAVGERFSCPLRGPNAGEMNGLRDAGRRRIPRTPENRKCGREG
jgi:glutamate-ammonia-ligase adenylyltransferase